LWNQPETKEMDKNARGFYLPMKDDVILNIIGSIKIDNQTHLLIILKVLRFGKNLNLNLLVKIFNGNWF
jgi:hypothetical protein